MVGYKLRLKPTNIRGILKVPQYGYAKVKCVKEKHELIMFSPICDMV